MEYQSFGNSGPSVSRLGLGCMRLPASKREAIALIRHAIDSGINYLDTAFVYGHSEEVLGEALKGGYRERVILASKCPLWHIKNYDDFGRNLNIQLSRLNTNHLDVYLLHNLYPNNLRRAEVFDAFGFLDDMQQKGTIGLKGFSIHNTFEAFRQISEDYYWDVAQIQLNILDEDEQVGIRGLYHGAALGLAMAIMEPLRGGTLLTHAPPAVTSLVRSHPSGRSLAEWCLRWLIDKDEATVILSGASSIEQLDDNLRIFERAAREPLTAQDHLFLQQLKAAYHAAYRVGCTGCAYCLPCPQGVNIPQVFKTYNHYLIAGKNSPIDRVYYQKALAQAGAGADCCTNCGTCSALCPQTLAVPELLREAHATLNVSFEELAAG